MNQTVKNQHSSSPLSDEQLDAVTIDKRIYDLYDEYCHGSMDRREFMRRAGAITVAGVSGLIMAQALMPRYARAQTISFNDERIKPAYVEYDSPRGNSGTMRGYLVTPAGDGPHPSVIVIHENRGLNPYVEDVARRLAVEGFLALAPDGLFPVGGYPGNDEDGKALQAGLDQTKLKQDMLNSAEFLRAHTSSTGKLGSVGFCWGGGTTNFLASILGENLHAAAPFYGAAVAESAVANISAPLMVQSAEDDERVNAMWPDFEAALTAAQKPFERHVYPGTRHGFHNNSTPRFNEEQARIAEERTVAFFKAHLV